MSTKRRGPVRQLSLQQSSRRLLKKQASEDLSRPLVQGHGLKWDTHNDTNLSVLASSLTSTSSNTRERKSANPQLSVRPRPVKIAWGERRQDTGLSVGVEVVAQKCKGLPRPVTAKPVRSSGLAHQNDSLLYSREQLAERLRMAWRERQENKQNLDIFLSHNSLDYRTNDEDVLMSSRDCSASIVGSPVPTDSRVKHVKYLEPVPPTSNDKDSGHELADNILYNYVSFEDEQNDLFKNLRSSRNEGNESRNNLQNSLTSKQTHDGKEVIVKNVAEIKISIIPENITDDMDENSCVDRNELQDMLQIGTNKTKLNDIEDCNTHYENIKDESEMGSAQNKQFIHATIKRVNFKNNKGGHLGNVSQRTASPPETPVENKSFPLRRAGHTLTRMMSAPTNKTSKNSTRERDAIGNINTNVATEMDDDERFIPKTERSVRSAPPRRKAKNAKKKGVGREDLSSDDECEDKTRNKKGSLKLSVKNADVVTMVSLLSPNESEVEEETCEPVLLTSRFCEDKDDVTNPVPAKSNHTVPQEAKAVGIFCLRKTPKTVCFQQPGNALLTRSYTSSYPSRRGAGTSLLVLDKEEKSFPVPPALSAPHPLTRKRIVKSKTTVNANKELSNEEELQDSKNIEDKPETTIQTINVEIPLVSEEIINENQEQYFDCKIIEDVQNNDAVQPNFKSQKEKECWNLYRKMMTKGIFVSYDTVLRGMLTPTEYRLHKTAMLASC